MAPASVLAMGNALVDTLIHVDNLELLSRLKLAPGGMTLINRRQLGRLREAAAELPRQRSSGGSAANTIGGLAALGAPSGYIGKVGRDADGRFFTQDLVRHRIQALLLESGSPTGQCLSLIKGDGERTMATFLGAAVELQAADLRPEFFQGYGYFHVEGYLVQNHSLLERALQLAQAGGLRISLDLASYNVVLENLDFLRRMVREHVDILFANEEEAAAFTGQPNPEQALLELSPHCHLAVVKIGKKGSLVRCGDTQHRIICQPAAVVDTTGAGDLYAAGFLYGMINGFDLPRCGRIGSLLAAKVIEVIGTKMTDATWQEIQQSLSALSAL